MIKTRRVTLAITMGDPAGIGPEIVLKALASPVLKRAPFSFVVIGDAALLRFHQNKTLRRHAAHSLRLVPLKREVGARPFKDARAIRVLDLGCSFDGTPTFGRASARGGRVSGEAIKVAVNMALRGEVDALVTAPINKVAFEKGGWGKRFVGHTEMLASLSRAKRVALMLVSGPLRAIHVTSHLPLRRVSAALSQQRIRETIDLAERGARLFNVRRPRIAVCGLNPHAGDGGLMGNEEQDIIMPAVRRSQRSGRSVVGPLPADTVWPRVLAGEFDIGVAMYHDQGQIPVKLMSHQAFHRRGAHAGVNVTVGIPFIRTSVDHGTAYELAGKGAASEASLVEAILLAARFARSRRS